ncbi:MAG: hypothetical protein CV088_04070 [Nitrospira sp. LK70]|nr:hypothetical protein [Nitrospira sp. LK70]
MDVRTGRLVLVLALTLLSGCIAHTEPAELFALTPDVPKNRVMQTRMFETPNERELLSASAAVLQDLGFQVEESQREVGFLRAAKERSAREYGQYVRKMLLLILSMGKLLEPIDLHQKIAASLVARPLNPKATRQEVRIMFYRVVWKGDGQADQQYIPPGEQYMEMIRDPEIYQQFFAKLSKAVFLEAHRI